MPRIAPAFLLPAALLSLLSGAAPAAAAAAPPHDRHAGYYYPQPGTVERYASPARPLPGADRRARIAFTIGVADVLAARPYPPQYALFAKGTDAEKLIIVGMIDGRLNTIYRARALLALMTSTARQADLLKQAGVDDSFTFLDYARLLGFERITVTDGHDFALQIRLTSRPHQPEK